MKYLLILIFTALVNSAFSQSPTTTYTLKDCIDYALQNNLNVQQAQVSVENSALTLNISKAATLPSVNGNFSGSTNSGRNIDPFTNGVVTQTIGTNSMGIGASLPVYQGGRLKNAIKRDKISLEAAQMDVSTQKNNIGLEVAIAYLNVLSAEDMIEVSNKQMEATVLQLEQTSKLVRAGALPETNLYDLEAQKANDELAIVNAQNSRETAFLSLKRSMNAPVNLMFKLERTGIPDPDMISTSTPLSSIHQAALGFLPEIKAGNLRLKASDVNIAIAKSLGQPSIVLSSNWGTAYSSAAQSVSNTIVTNQEIPVSAVVDGQTVPFVLNFPNTSYEMEDMPYFKQLGNNRNFNFGVSVNIPIFNGHNTKYQTQSAKIQKRQVELQNKTTELQVKQNIDQAYLDMLNAQKKYAATNTQTKALEKAYVAAEKRFNAGAGTFVDYNLAKTNLDRAKANLVQAKYDYLFRIKILDFYQNKPLEF